MDSLSLFAETFPIGVLIGVALLMLVAVAFGSSRERRAGADALGFGCMSRIIPPTVDLLSGAASDNWPDVSGRGQAAFKFVADSLPVRDMRRRRAINSCLLLLDV